jgi:prepilin signal peptidase PulO-like enzyme (type II secretory pathway)
MLGHMKSRPWTVLVAWSVFVTALWNLWIERGSEQLTLPALLLVLAAFVVVIVSAESRW